MENNLCSVKRKHFDKIFNEYFRTEDITEHVKIDKEQLYSNYEIIKIHLHKPDNIDDFLHNIFKHIITYWWEDYWTTTEEGKKYVESLANLIKYIDNEKDKPLKDLTKWVNTVLRWKNKQLVDLDLEALTQLRELWEIILFFLTEWILNAPIAISKIRLKTNPQMPVYWSDGIHISKCWEKLIFWESKLTWNFDWWKTQSRNWIIKHTTKEFLQKELRVINKNYLSIVPEKWKIMSPYSKIGDINNLPYELTCFLWYEDDDYKDFLKTKDIDKYEKSLKSKVIKILTHYGKKSDELDYKKVTFFLLPFVDLFSLLEKYWFKLRDTSNFKKIKKQ